MHCACKEADLNGAITKGRACNPKEHPSTAKPNRPILLEIRPSGFKCTGMLLGVTCTTLGYSSIQIGLLARAMHGLRPRLVQRMQKIMTYDRATLVGLSWLGGGGTSAAWAPGLPLFETRIEPGMGYPPIRQFSVFCWSSLYCRPSVSRFS